MINFGQFLIKSQLSIVRQCWSNFSSQTLFKPGFFGAIKTFKPHFEPFVVLKHDKSTDVTRKTKETKRPKTTRFYSEKDDKKLINLVEKYGYSLETFKRAAKELGRDNYYSVKKHYDEYIAKQHNVTGAFSPEEDQKILDYVAKNGRSEKSYKELAKDLDRSVNSVRLRCSRLLSSNEFESNNKSKGWELDDDEQLINFVIKLKEMKTKDVSQLETVKPSELIDIASKLKKRSSSCYIRWMCNIVPTIKSYLKKLPMTVDWKKDILNYIAKNKIIDKSKIDIDQLLHDVAPGQTKRSLLQYLDNLKRETIDGKPKYSDKTLFDCASKKLREQKQYDPCFNENNKRELKRLEWCEEIVAIYEKKF